MPVGGSSSRSGRLARISQSNIRPFGSGTYGGGYGPGGQPLSGPDPTSPVKKDVKHRFEITKKLGSGTYGKVSLAFDHKFEREVAVKLIKKSAIENRADLVRIRREIRIMSALNHPNIIQIFEVFENKDKIILVMEYACGGELYDYVSQFGSLPESEARRIFRQITSAVLYCHKHQVAHRDLKLENILLDQDNNAKIADFGLSNYFSDKSLLATFCGSPLYASPEIINGTPYRGPEVDCWSLGILLYTLVYGSMPFDGRDFNRMVRQIKRGAYYEPDTPSTASMLIRNMLRVNPDRRADIFDIASHWWLNLEENMPVIQELPENQITDHTPLTERAETMIVQDLADETDVFMEFGHLSSETRKKIEEFRRRRQVAEEYNENSPVKPPKARKTENDSTKEVMRIEEKSLREIKEKKKEEPTDPLERLRQIENRLGQQRSSGGAKQILKNGSQAMPSLLEKPAQVKALKDDQATIRTITRHQELTKNMGERNTSPEQPEDPKPARKQPKNRSESRPPLFVPVNDSEATIIDRRGTLPMRPPVAISTYRIETDSLNILMNQVLEQMEKGPVSLNLVARIKAHPLYDTRPMVKELLESIIAAQPVNVQKQTSKIIQQQSQDIGRRNSRKNVFDAPHSTTKRVDKSAKASMEERPWHSIEVGFDPDEESDMEMSQRKSVISTSTEITIQDTSFEDNESIKEENVQRTPTKIVNTQTQTDKSTEEDSEEDSEEYTDSEMEELADEVEQEENITKSVVSEVTDSLPPPDPIVGSPSQFSNTFDRGLIKRQSKGKYQHNRVDMYGRGVSTECDSPIMPRKLLGGPQPTPEQSPFLFDKAKKILMQYPRGPNLSELEDDLFEKKRKNLLKSQNSVHQGEAVMNITPALSCVGSLPPRTPPPIKSDQEESDDDINEEEEVSEEDSSEQSEEEIENRKPRGPVIGALRRDGHKIETMTVEISGRKSSFMQSAPASIHASPSPEPAKLTSPSAKYYLTSTEMNLKSPIEPKPYTRIAIGGSNVAHNKLTMPKKISEHETLLKDSRESLPLEERIFYTNPLFRPTYANSDLFPRKPASTTDTHGKENWESAAAYIRRKNRERRYRNRTIGTPEEIQRTFDRSFVETPFSGERRMSPGHGRFSPITADSLSSHIGTTGSSHINHIYSRCHDENYWVKDHSDRPLSPTRYTVTNAMREERRSFSIHDTSPDCSEYRAPGYSIGDCRSYHSSNMSPNYNRKFAHEATLKSWAAEPRRFEVYKTRAERDAERNTMVTPLSYRPSSYCSTGCDRPLTSYGYQKKEDFYKPENYRGSDSYRSKFDENPSYRRNISDMERAGAGNSNTDHYMGFTSNTIITEPVTSSVLNRFRPKTSRVASVLSDGDKKIYTRTRSMDRKQLRGEDHDYGSQIRNRLTTPEVIPDYTYVNYHDSSNGRSGSQIKDDKGQPKSILKNKQNAEVEPRTDSGSNRAVEGGIGPVRSVFVRLRRHLSLEKSASPQRQTMLPRIQETPGVSTPSLGGNLRDSLGTDTNEDYPKKKRSILAFNRRRTSDMRLGTEGKLITNGYDDLQFKRPSSPIDKLKSLFRKTDSIQTPQHTGGDYYVLGRYSGGAKDKVFGIYPSSHAAGPREAYAAQYRRYPGTSSRDPSVALNRYSYTPGMTEQRRHWHDDHNIF